MQKPAVSDAKVSRCFGVASPVVDAQRVAACNAVLRAILQPEHGTRFAVAQVLCQRAGLYERGVMPHANVQLAVRGAARVGVGVQLGVAARRPSVHVFISCHIREAEEQLSVISALVRSRAACTTWDSARSLVDGDFDAERARLGIGASTGDWLPLS